MEDDREMPWNFHTCRLCSYRSKSTFLMCRHVRLHRSRSNTATFTCDSASLELFECEVCVFETNLKVNLAEHIRILHEEKDTNIEMKNILKCYRCKSCNLKTRSLFILIKHFASCKARFKHNFSKACAKTKLSTESEGNEVKPSEGGKRRQCKQCSYKTTLKHEMRNHILMKHRNLKHRNWFKCHKCTYKSTLEENLKRHITAKHTKAEKVNCFKCRQCAFKTEQKFELERHVIAKHTNLKSVRWLKCSQCAYRTVERGRLKQHVLVRHGSQEHKTSNSSKMAKSGQNASKTTGKGNLKLHLTKLCNPEDIPKFI